MAVHIFNTGRRSELETYLLTIIIELSVDEPLNFIDDWDLILEVKGVEDMWKGKVCSLGKTLSLPGNFDHETGVPGPSNVNTTYLHTLYIQCLRMWQDSWNQQAHLDSHICSEANCVCLGPNWYPSTGTKKAEDGGKGVNMASKLQEVHGLENGSGSQDSAARVKPWVDLSNLFLTLLKCYWTLPE